MATVTVDFPLQFKRLFDGPLDLEAVFNTTADRLAYLNSGARYAGQLVSDLQDGKIYMLNNSKTAWVDVLGNGGGSAGSTGATGATGTAGPSGATGPSGLAGASGLSGNAGLSAYQIAVNQGFIGSEYEWLHTINSPLKEKVLIYPTPLTTSIASPLNIDVNAYQCYLFLQGVTSDFAVNFRASSTATLDSILSTGQSVTCAFTIVNGANAYKIAKILIDGAEVPVSYWYSGEDAVANSAGVFSVSVVKTGSNQYFVTVNQAPLTKVII
jgi:hypothetical protein